MRSAVASVLNSSSPEHIAPLLFSPCSVLNCLYLDDSARTTLLRTTTHHITFAPPIVALACPGVKSEDAVRFSLASTESVSGLKERCNLYQYVSETPIEAFPAHSYDAPRVGIGVGPRPASVSASRCARAAAERFADSFIITLRISTTPMTRGKEPLHSRDSGPGSRVRGRPAASHRLQERPGLG